jgi:hypothetical protein
MNFRFRNKHNNIELKARHWWFTPIILGTWEVEMGSIKVRGQPRQIVHETPISKIT